MTDDNDNDNDDYLLLDGVRIRRKCQRPNHQIPTAEPECLLDSSPKNHTPTQHKEDWKLATSCRTFEYIDHPADVGVTCTSQDLTECFIGMGLALTAYMTDIDRVEAKEERRFSVEADSLELLLYNFLDEVLALYGEEYFMTARIAILSFESQHSNQWTNFQTDTNQTPQSFRIKVLCLGEPFDHQRHLQGTEIKAITMHNIQVTRGSDNAYTCQVLLDI